MCDRLGIPGAVGFLVRMWEYSALMWFSLKSLELQSFFSTLRSLTNFSVTLTHLFTNGPFVQKSKVRSNG